jgi:hypothetical protein
VTDAGITIDRSDGHPLKAFLPMRVSFDPDSKLTLVRSSRSEKNSLPMISTDRLTIIAADQPK